MRLKTAQILIGIAVGSALFFQNACTPSGSGFKLTEDLSSMTDTAIGNRSAASNQPDTSHGPAIPPPFILPPVTPIATNPSLPVSGKNNFGNFPLSGVTVTQNGKSLCNSVSFNQVPNRPELFVGRMLQNTTSDSCSGTSWGVGLFQMDWKTHSLQHVRNLLMPGTSISGGEKITSAYDPTIFFYAGEYWMAAECVGDGIQGVGSCMGPVNLNGSIDGSRTTVVISGVSSDPNSPDSFSASVPKLFLFKGEPYLYWTAVQISKKDGHWGGLTVRGTKLSKESGGARRFWSANSMGAPLPSKDDARNVEVFGINPNDPTANAMADANQIYSVGDVLYLLGGVGGTGCLNPLSSSYGCYRLRIASSNNPLGRNTFNENMAQSPGLPTNPQEYTRVYENPDGSRFVLATFLAASYNRTEAVRPVSAGFQWAQFDLASLKFAPVGSFAELPTPANDSRVEVIHTSFSALKSFIGACDQSKPISLECNVAIKRFCRSQGFPSSGFGPVQYSGDSANVVCLSGDKAKVLPTTYSNLRSLQPLCNPAQPMSATCNSAISRFCVQQNYLAGGFGPNDAVGDNINVTCLQKGFAEAQNETFTTLRSFHPACSFADPFAPACFAAIDKFCAAKGLVTGFGIQDYSESNAAFSCLKSQ